MMFRLSPRHALALAAALAAAPALQAAQPTEEQLRSIKLYGNTTIAEDSVDRWGFWEQFEAPAAGGSPSASLPGAGSPAGLYRPLASVTAPVAPSVPTIQLPCESGGLCGFGMFTTLEGFVKQPSPALETAAALEEGPGLVINAHPYAFSGQVVEGTNDSIWPYPYSVQVTTVALGSTPVPAAHNDTVVMDDGCCTYYGNGVYADVQVDSKSQLDMEVAWYTGMVRTDGESRFPTGIAGVAGRLTSAADMDALNKGQVVATYSGRLLSERYAEVRDNVQLTVDFGKSTFTGVVNGGADTPMLTTQPLPSGQTMLQRGVGFNIDAGTISGSKFQATRFSATDGTVAGTVSGGFFGPSAAAAGGVIDVNKSRTDGTYTNGKFVMPFLTRKFDNSEK